MEWAASGHLTSKSPVNTPVIFRKGNPTVEKTAAGTLKMTVMIGLRFRSMKTVAIRLVKKLHIDVSFVTVEVTGNLRNNEEN